jgi:hypothetical protein
LRAAEQDRPDVARKRRWWRSWQRFMDRARFVLPNETGIVAPLVLDGPKNGPAFRAYAEQFLAPAPGFISKECNDRGDRTTTRAK